MIRRKRKTRRFIRRRTRRNRRNNRTSGIRFFKLRSISTGGIPSGTTRWDNNPSLPAQIIDWPRLAGLFEYYRVVAFKIDFIPAANVNNIGDIPGQTNINVIHDWNMSLPPQTTDSLLEFEKVKIKSSLRRFQYYAKCVNSMTAITVGTLASGYKLTSTPQATNQIVTQASQACPGIVIRTLYIAFKYRS